MKIISKLLALALFCSIPLNTSEIHALDNNKYDEFNAMPLNISAKLKNELKLSDPLPFYTYNVGDDYDFSDMNSLYTHYDTEKFLKICDNAKALADENVDFEKISEAIDEMYGELAEVGSLYGIMNVIFYSDTGNPEYSEELQYTYDTYNMIKLNLYQFIKELAKSEIYYDALVEYVGREQLDLYINDDILSEEDNEYMKRIKALQTQYYSLTNSSASENEFAELYLETVRLNNEYARFCGYENYIEYAYDNYSRDYGTDTAASFCESVNRNITPVFIEMRSNSLRDENYFNYMSYKFTADEILGILDRYTERMSSEINDSYKYMRKTNAYSIEKKSDGKSRYKGAFTIYLPGYNVPYIFSTLEGNASDLAKVIHEFGHYNEYCLSGKSGSSIDVSEISSQSLELIFSNYYPEIFGEKYSDISVENLLVRKLWSLVSGAMIADFEMQAYMSDDMTADELISLYDELEMKYIGSRGNMKWQSVSHIFEMPGYYISYSVSAAASFELWNTSVYDFEKAVSDYISVIGTSSSLGISETLLKSGMNDIFDDDTISDTAFTLRRKYIDKGSPSGGYDINGDGIIAADDALEILLFVTGKNEFTAEQQKLADINGDGSITPYDAMLILRKVVGIMD